MVPLTSRGKKGRGQCRGWEQLGRGRWASREGLGPLLFISQDRHWEALQIFISKAVGASTKQEGQKQKQQQLKTVEVKGPFPFLVPFFSPAGVGRS